MLTIHVTQSSHSEEENYLKLSWEEFNAIGAVPYFKAFSYINWDNNEYGHQISDDIIMRMRERERERTNWNLENRIMKRLAQDNIRSGKNQMCYCFIRIIYEFHMFILQP